MPGNLPADGVGDARHLALRRTGKGARGGPAARDAEHADRCGRGQREDTRASRRVLGPRHSMRGRVHHRGIDRSEVSSPHVFIGRDAQLVTKFTQLITEITRFQEAGFITAHEHHHRNRFEPS
ncbi:MAG: hypothetical protein ACXWAY_06140 [Acidimicrobiia bacterium]